MARSFFAKKRNDKAFESVQALEGESGAPLSQAVVTGRQKFEWTDLASFLTCAFVVMFFFMLAGGRLVLPGAILIGLWYESVKPTRLLSLTPQTVTLWKASILTGKATEALGTFDRASIHFENGWVSLPEGPPIKLSDTEAKELSGRERLLRA